MRPALSKEKFTNRGLVGTDTGSVRTVGVSGVCGRVYAVLRVGDTERALSLGVEGSFVSVLPPVLADVGVGVGVAAFFDGEGVSVEVTVTVGVEE